MLLRATERKPASARFVEIHSLPVEEPDMRRSSRGGGHRCATRRPLGRARRARGPPPGRFEVAGSLGPPLSRSAPAPAPRRPFPTAYRTGRPRNPPNPSLASRLPPALPAGSPPVTGMGWVGPSPPSPMPPRSPGRWRAGTGDLLGAGRRFPPAGTVTFDPAIVCSNPASDEVTRMGCARVGMPKVSPGQPPISFAVPATRSFIRLSAPPWRRRLKHGAYPPIQVGRPRAVSPRGIYVEAVLEQKHTPPLTPFPRGGISPRPVFIDSAFLAFTSNLARTGERPVWLELLPI